MRGLASAGAQDSREGERVVDATGTPYVGRFDAEENTTLRQLMHELQLG